MRVRAALLLLLLPAAAYAEPNAMAPDPKVLHDLAPTGTLRAAINLGNPVLAQGGAGSPAGVSVDLARALATRLGVPVAFVTFPGAGAVSGSAGAGTWDICFLAIDPKRAEGIAFTEPYVLIAGSYLVPATSPIRSPEAVDRDGVRVSVGRGSAYDLFLSRALTRATLVRAPTSAEAVAVFARDGLDVAAGVHQPLAAYAAAHPEVRLLPGHFMAIPQAMGMPVGRPAGAAYLADFVAQAKRDGLVRRGLKASGQDPDLAAP
ncbi:ABC transporter substrate-binding protein [Methylobacterium oryzae]|uniref:ABC transporter substrate-binding protein n=1 Tax=Methylobacterium oryzae TaxID=334852 RepID=A0ABU7TVJ8_9HYPH